MNNIDNETEILLTLYKEHIGWSKHQETQRSIISNLIITISLILVGFITYDKALKPNDIIGAVALVFLGLFGALFSYKYYERFVFHDNRIEKYKIKIEELFPQINIKEMDRQAILLTEKKFTFFKNYRLHLFWIFFHLFIALGGLLLVFAIYYTSP